MPNEADSVDFVVIVVDGMEFRRTLMVNFLKNWAIGEGVELLSFAPANAHEAMRDGVACKMIIFNAGVATCSNPDTLAELKVLRALAPSASLVVVTYEELREDVIAVVESGADGYLSNQSDPELVLRVLSFVLKGGTYFPRSVIALDPLPRKTPVKAAPEASRALTDGEPAGNDWSSDSLFSDFTERQRAILEGLCRGEPNKIIGRVLNLPESTVKVHVREIMRKLSVSNRTQVAVVMSRLGFAVYAKNGQASEGLPQLSSARPKPLVLPLRPDTPTESVRANAVNDESKSPDEPGSNLRTDCGSSQREAPLALGKRKIGK